jgi:hypothetical protein
MRSADARERRRDSMFQQQCLPGGLMIAPRSSQLRRVRNLASVMQDYTHAHKGLIHRNPQRGKSIQEQFCRFTHEFNMAKQAMRRVELAE